MERKYVGTIMPGVVLGPINLGTLDALNAHDQIQSTLDKLYADQLVFIADGKEVPINLIAIPTADPDLAYTLLSVDVENIVENAMSFGREGNWLVRTTNAWRTLIAGVSVPLVYDLDEESLLEGLQSSLSALENPSVNARLVVKEVKEKKEIEVLPAVTGQVFDYESGLAAVHDRVRALQIEPIKLTLVTDEPDIRANETTAAVALAQKMLTTETLKLNVDKRWWKLNQPQFSPWLILERDETGQVITTLDEELLAEFLDPIAAAVSVEALDAKFELVDGRVREFQASRDGETLDYDISRKIITAALNGKHESEIDEEGLPNIALAITVDPAKVKTGDVNDLGITELLGQGRSDFSGSPRNRRHNIRIGAESLNGLLIAPDEEFSMIDSLGDINGANGYLQELVIKGDRTIPEFGGGLCQIGTTAFRMALHSAMPITARRNHSYSVSYYWPPGTDATIYDPAPDFRFKNDTGHNVLIQTYMEGDEMVFELYGTNDGREAVFPEVPETYNRVSPGEPRYIETDELAPGEKKLVERPHDGLSAHFEYTINYPDGETDSQDFYSHYRPWKETWLVGRTSTSTSETGDELIGPVEGNPVISG